MSREVLIPDPGYKKRGKLKERELRGWYSEGEENLSFNLA